MSLVEGEAGTGQRYKFIVGSAEEAASVIRQRLGERARVVAVRQVEGEGLARFLKAPRLEVIAEVPAESAAETAPPAVVAKEQAPPVTPSPAPAPEPAAPVASKLWTILERAGLRQELLARLRDRAEWNALARLPLAAALARASLLLRDAVPDRARALTMRTAFFGSPGAGATTALCKQLAHDVFLAGRAACVLKLDGEQPNPTEGLAMFCEALGVPLLRTASELCAVPAETAVYFDVPGISLTESATVRLNHLLDEFAVDSRVLVVNAAYDGEILRAAFARAAAMGGTHAVFTHVDEVQRCGKLWEYAFDETLAPLFASTGQNVAGDCERGVIELLVRRTLAAADRPSFEAGAKRSGLAAK